MATNEILDRKIEDFFKNKFSDQFLKDQLSGNTLDPNKHQKLINDFVFNISTLPNQQYCLLKIHEKFERLELTPQNERNMSYDFIENFNNNRRLTMDDLILKLEDLGLQLETEMFTSEDFNLFKEELANIAKSIFELQQRQEAANEVLFNSVEEIKEQLFKEAEKGKIFGKEFVKQQLAGKLMDMTMKGGATAFISYLPEHLSKIQKFLGEII